MPHCHKCGAELEENARFCHACGTPIAAATMPASHMRGSSLIWPLLTTKGTRLPVLKDRRLWFAAILVVTADFLILAIGTDSVLLPLRWLVSIVFSLVLPGYCLVVALFSKKELGIAETICLSVVSSFGILALNGLLVNSLLGRIDLVLLMCFLSLEVLSLIMSTVFKHREQNVPEEKIDS